VRSPVDSTRAAGFRIASRLDAPPEGVWARVSTLAGVNSELRPLVRMTAPPDLDALDGSGAVMGERLFRSWLLLFGLIPFDYDDLTLVRLDPGRGFMERSSMLSQRVWEHERTLEPSGASGCLLADRLHFEPRPPLRPALVAPVVRKLFSHRHSRLRAHFGGEPS
jgi:ligand-binding SRPBCC domain-containing protein